MTGVSSLRFSCSVCAEDYTESGEHEAKLLPCTHTVCKHCVENKLFQYFERSLTCPVCNKEHHFCDGVESVPENQYIQVMIRKGRGDICMRHRNEFILFCKERECLKRICGLCLTDEHKGHEFDSLENLSKELIVEMESLNNTSTESKEKIESLRLENCQRSKTCKEQIELAREQTLKRLSDQFDKLVAEVNKAKIEVETKLNDVAEKITDKLQMEEIMKKDVGSRLQAVQTMKTEMTNLVLELDSSKYFEFLPVEVSENELPNICGSLIQKNFQPNISLQETTTTSHKEVNTTGSPPPKRRCKETPFGEGGSKFEFKVEKSFNPDCKFVRKICLLSDNRSIVCGCQDHFSHFEVSVCSPKAGRTRKIFDGEPRGMAEVTMDGKQCLVLVWNKEMEFIDLKNFKKKVATIRETRKFFQGICTSSSSTLWYMCWSSEKKADKGELVQLDCKSSPPQVKSTVRVEINIKDSFEDMCLLNIGNKTVVVVAQCSSGLTAYNTETGLIQWRVAGRLEDGKFCPVSHLQTTGGTPICFTRVAADGQGHVFAVDCCSDCVHVLASDGKYLDSLNEGRLVPDCVRAIRWCERTSSLVVSHSSLSDRHVITYANVK